MGLVDFPLTTTIWHVRLRADGLAAWSNASDFPSGDHVGYTSTRPFDRRTGFVPGSARYTPTGKGVRATYATRRWPGPADPEAFAADEAATSAARRRTPRRMARSSHSSGYEVKGRGWPGTGPSARTPRRGGAARCTRD